MSYAVYDDTEYIWSTTTFKHELRIETINPINLLFLPTELQLKLIGNKVVGSTSITLDHLSWCDHNCTAPFIIGRDYILFSDEVDRTMFLTAH